MKKNNKKKETYYFDRTINQSNNLKTTLGKIANLEFNGFEDGDIIYFFVLNTDKEVSILYFANYDNFNVNEYIFVDKIMLLNLENEINFTDFYKNMQKKLTEIKNANS